MYSLIVETGKHKGKRLKLPFGESIVGRDEEADIRIASEEVSRKHCVLVTAEQSIVVRDLGSSNGTFVNGRPIAEETSLNPGDLLVIGPMGFRLPQPEAPASGGKSDSSQKIAKPDSQRLSDDDIAAWLTVGSGSADANEDTAVIDAPGAVRPEPEAPIAPAPKRVFRTVAEEAADIIRRHRESLRSGE